MNHRLHRLWWRANGHKVESVSGHAVLPDGTEFALGNAPLVTDRTTGAKSIRWAGFVWPVLETGDKLKLGFPGSDV